MDSSFGERVQDDVPIWSDVAQHSPGSLGLLSAIQGYLIAQQSKLDSSKLLLVLPGCDMGRVIDAKIVSRLQKIGGHSFPQRGDLVS
jgi:hypothetical protein